MLAVLIAKKINSNPRHVEYLNTDQYGDTNALPVQQKKPSTFDHLNSQRIIFTVYFYNAYLLLNRVPINYICQLQQLAVLSF